MRQWSIHVVLPSIAAAELALDVPDGFLTHGAIGFWQLVISLLALQLDLVPALLAYLGIVAALLNWLTIFGNMLATARSSRRAPSPGGPISVFPAERNRPPVEIARQAIRPLERKASSNAKRLGRRKRKG